jgi:hypothetical protein
MASTGADFEPDKDPPSSVGKCERYVPRAERAVLVLAADSTAAPTPQPHKVRLSVKPVVDGKLGDVLSTTTIYLMVINKP